MSDPNFIFLRCSSYLLPTGILENGAHRSKTDFTLGPSSDVNFTSDTGLFVNLPHTGIHALHSQFSNHPVSDVKLTPEPGPSMNYVLLRWVLSLKKVENVVFHI